MKKINFKINRKNIFGKDLGEKSSKKKGAIALSQIFILLIGIIAIGYAVGSEVGMVSGDAPSTTGEPASGGGGNVLRGIGTSCSYNGQSGTCQSSCVNGNLYSSSQGATGCKNFKTQVKCCITDGTTTGPGTGEIPPINTGSCGKPKCENDEECQKACGDERAYCRKGSISATSQIAGGEGCAIRDITGKDATESGFRALEGLAWGIGIGAGVKQTLSAFGVEEGTSTQIGTVAGTGVGVGKVLKEFGWVTSSTSAIGWGLFGAAVIFLATYRETSKRTVSYESQVWQPPKGGANCDRCNKQGILPCSEYQCRSLGQGCELVNTEESGEAKCVWINPNDVNPPEIIPWEGALIEGKYTYELDEKISPPDVGVKINYIGEGRDNNGCIPAYSQFTFGVNSTKEPAQCKVDFEQKKSFDEMSYYFGGSTLFRNLHKQVLKASQLKSETNESGALELENKNEYEVAVRCADKNGNENKGNFVFKFCVQQGLDTTPPLITATDPANNMPFAYNTTNMPINIYVNEPAECAWSLSDMTYDRMLEQENPDTYRLTCDNEATDINAMLSYSCIGIIDGLKSDSENKIYFRCKDQPGEAEEDRNANAESYILTLKGTRPLEIKTLEPNTTIRDSTERVLVKLKAVTSAGYNDGIATCYYSANENGPWNINNKFLSTGISNTHSTELQLPQGTYTYYIRCVDLGGNANMKSTSFVVDSDNAAPIVVRIYKDNTKVKLITNEQASCVYSLEKCDFKFEDGVSIRNLNKTEHVLDWNADKTYYIKCKDNYGNQPTLQSECSVSVQPFERDVAEED